ncbi:hypothetical protein CERSUDRAFT_138713 [Gelatoporia subvermispora B]|uniref:Meiotically up-regulated protein Msb1/Mug8 domain-containing protein n=1 Tax=Ceriporiopsis subvermispora (strain B) TaxID=914234 RepID=M2RC68_CERS8|nr:hypothetical protein CERSUDRAFT_138713 [Gelatoporia subvermispora B]
MPSLFSRARAQSSPSKKPSLDEFGRISSRGGAASPAPASVKKDKDKKGSKDSKQKTKSKHAAPEADEDECAIPDGSFLPLNLEHPQLETSDGSPPTAQQAAQNHDYGYLSFGRHVVLGLEELARLVDVVGEELGTRGLTTPFIFSTLALDVSATAVRRLIQAFLRTCGKPSAEATRQWRDEARFAGPHELGMCLRWGLARVVRIVGGQEVRGILAYEFYAAWRDAEQEMSYPEGHFAAFLDPLDPLLQTLLVGLVTLFTRFTAHSASSGHTPPTLSPLFGPLLFGLGPSTLAFHHAYIHYLRATTATEHLILAFIRWQNVPKTGATASATSMGLPTRLKAWIQGYPATLPSIGRHERPQPRRGARTVRVVSVRRNVRMYSPDLVKSAASWAHRPRGAVSSAGDRSFVGSKEWERIAPPTLKLPPRYSDAYKKRMDLPPNFHPDTGAGSSTSTLSVPSLTSSVSTASSASTLFDDREHGILSGAGEDRFRSLTDLKWGEFEVMGFGNVGADDKKLQFDLTEGARAARAAKRATLTWQDFSSTGFSRTDAPLNATLQFSAPVTNTVNSWPAHSAEISRKLKKTQKALPPFGWDTEPIIGREEVIEEAFVDVFCDLIYGGGWMDIERCEEVDRECNWALVEFKSVPIARNSTTPGTGDPRISTTLILFEEFVPYEYRQQMAVSGRTRRRLPSLFSVSSKSKQWKPAATLNGRPYVIGHVPASPSYREVEFEGLLRSNGSSTKVISLAKNPEGTRGAATPASTAATPGHQEPLSLSSLKIPTPQFLQPITRTRSNPEEPRRPAEEPTKRPPKVQDPPTSPTNRLSRIRLPTSPVSGKKLNLPPAEYDTIDFHTRLASFDDEDQARGASTKQSRRRSRDDAWVDILVTNNGRRMASQDAVMRPAGVRGGRSDPDLVSQEISEVLAAIQAHPDTDDEDTQPVHAPDQEEPPATASSLAYDEPERDSVLHGEEDEDDPPRAVIQKRLGYFDLHPERRHAPSGDSRSSEPGRQSFDSTGDAGMQHTDDGASSWQSHSSYTTEENEENLEATPNPSFYQPAFAQGTQSLSQRDLPVVNVSPPPVTPPENAPTPAPTPAATSKTASLIQMYREKERATTTPAPASRLPVRSGSLPDAPNAPRTSPAPPEIEEVPVNDNESVLEEVPEPDLPVRYVHGAPLHNVLEEEEEEY